MRLCIFLLETPVDAIKTENRTKPRHDPAAIFFCCIKCHPQKRFRIFFSRIPLFKSIQKKHKFPFEKHYDSGNSDVQKTKYAIRSLFYGLKGRPRTGSVGGCKQSIRRAKRVEPIPLSEFVEGKRRDLTGIAILIVCHSYNLKGKVYV